MNAPVFFRILTCSWSLLVAYLSLTGSPPEISAAVVGWDKFQHAGAYFILTILTIRALCVDTQRLRSAVIVSIFLAGSLGVLLEVLQGVMHNGRMTDPFDALANTIGSMAAGSLYWIWQKRLRWSGKIVLLWLGCALIQGGQSAYAEEQYPVVTDAAAFLAALPAAGARMATFPANQSVTGPWWTLTALSVAGISYAYDDEIRRQVQDSRSTSLNRAADAGSLMGNPVAHVGLLSGIYVGGWLLECDDWRQVAIRGAEALFLADAITLTAKEVVGRSRPNTGADSDQLRPFRFDGRNDSLPSLHTASSFALATVLAQETDSRFITAGYYLAAVWVGAARVIQDRHWTSDVVLGAAIGGLSGWSVRQEPKGAGRQQLALLPLVMPHGAGIRVAGIWN